MEEILTNWGNTEVYLHSNFKYLLEEARQVMKMKSAGVKKNFDKYLGTKYKSFSSYFYSIIRNKHQCHNDHKRL